MVTLKVFVDLSSSYWKGAVLYNGDLLFQTDCWLVGYDFFAIKGVSRIDLNIDPVAIFLEPGTPEEHDPSTILTKDFLLTLVNDLIVRHEELVEREFRSDRGIVLSPLLSEGLEKTSIGQKGLAFVSVFNISV